MEMKTRMKWMSRFGFLAVILLSVGVMSIVAPLLTQYIEQATTKIETEFLNQCLEVLFEC